ncbi:MAG: hypothetical protein K2M91_02545, partial [Lachnospiraceae bacterium]|nr:hypothetical protein [Lachnospiraceae bacterium]
IHSKMKGKNSLITRCLGAGICIVVMVIVVFITRGAGKSEDKKPEEQTVYDTNSRIQSEPDKDWYSLNQDNCLRQDIGNGKEFLFQTMQVEGQNGTDDTIVKLNVNIYRKGETEPFQELQTDFVEQDTDPFVFKDFNADGYLDLIFIRNRSYILVSYLWSQSEQKFVRGPEELDGYDYYKVIVDKDSRNIRVSKEKSGNYESDTYQWSNEIDFELVKSFYDTRTENGALIRIVSFCDGEEQILMDCEYDTNQFPYYIERYNNYCDIICEFYVDKLVWEKTIPVDNLNKTYTLHYAQKIQYDREDEEHVTGYEGHLWVTDEDTKIVKRMFWQSEAPYKNIIWEEQKNAMNNIGEPMLFIQFADGSERTCSLSEILKDPAEAVYEKSMQIDYGIKEYSIDTEKYNSMTEEIYKDAFYRALSSQDKVRTSEEEEVYLKEYWYYQGDSLMQISDEIFLKNLIDNTEFYYMDFDGDGLPELVMDIIGDGLHILKYLPDEEIVEIFFGYERMPYYNLLGSGQLYYCNGMLANKEIWSYDIVDVDGQDSQVIYFEEDFDYKPHKENEDEWWDTAYWVYVDEELGMVQVDEKSYQE